MALTAEQSAALLKTLQTRFEKHPNRHAGLAWAAVQARLVAQPAKLWALHELERTGGEPDVVGQDALTGVYLFYDCAAESPKERRSVCYDGTARTERKNYPPETSALELAAAWGVELLTEEQYHALQQLGKFDTKTSSWLQTPADIRQRGGAIYGDRRYERVFIYHNGADSYYAGRGFRAVVRV